MASRTHAGAATLTAAHQRNLHDEDVGVRHRIEHFYLPLFDQYCEARHLARRALRILDCGCGNGLSVDLLATFGFRACGIDLWSVRVDQWTQASHPRKTFCAADATRLPFRDGSFDLVFSCGLLEHIGVAEEGHPTYRVAPLPNQAGLRRRFFSESLRVLKATGLLYVDHPNGAFPIDFWHNDYRSRPRVHSPFERFLPSFGEDASHARGIDPRCRVRALSPAGRFTFRRSRRRWYGQAFGALVERCFSLLRLAPFSRLARSPLNPYLVIEIGRFD